jgi:hypothetical protein
MVNDFYVSAANGCQYCVILCNLIEVYLNHIIENSTSLQELLRQAKRSPYPRPELRRRWFIINLWRGKNGISIQLSSKCFRNHRFLAYSQGKFEIPSVFMIATLHIYSSANYMETIHFSRQYLARQLRSRPKRLIYHQSIILAAGLKTVIQVTRSATEKASYRSYLLEFCT